MTNTLVSARISPAKKAAVGDILKSLDATTSDLINDAFYILKRYQNSSSVQSAIRELSSFVNISVLSSDDYRKATQLEWNDLENCLVSLAASHANADYLITRDETGFKQSPIPVLTPAELLEHLHAEHRLTYDSVANFNFSKMD